MHFRIEIVLYFISVKLFIQPVLFSLKFDTYVCQTAREAFKGALRYAFGNKAELNINKLLTHGDDFCEVFIRIP